MPSSFPSTSVLVMDCCRLLGVWHWVLGVGVIVGCVVVLLVVVWLLVFATVLGCSFGSKGGLAGVWGSVVWV